MIVEVCLVRHAGPSLTESERTVSEQQVYRLVLPNEVSLETQLMHSIIRVGTHHLTADNLRIDLFYKCNKFRQGTMLIVLLQVRRMTQIE